MDIVIDFDGTCVTHEYPRVGRDIGAVPVLKELVDAGHRLILFTMREKIGLDRLKDAVDWFEDNGIPLYGIQTNPEQKSWTDSPKALANLHIDDAGLGIPLVPAKGRERAYVDWKAARILLEQRGIIPKKPAYKLFLDDERNPEDVYNFLMADANGDPYLEMEAFLYKNNEDWVVVRTFHEFVGHIATYDIPSIISFDHDLADFTGPNGRENTGMDAAKWLVSVLMNMPHKFPNWFVHSKNSVGAENINKYMENAMKHIYL